MREQLIHYVDLLFAGAPQAGEIKQEILQNTLDRYDDLISQGKSPQAAYQLAICGIGDINELLGAQPAAATVAPHPSVPAQENRAKGNSLVTAIAVALYILCPLPLFLLSDVGNGSIGLCLLLLMVAAATALLIIFGETKAKEPVTQQTLSAKPGSELLKSINTLMSVLGWIVYLALSIATKAWLVTWLVFPIVGAVKGLFRAIYDLKEACKHES